jgi:gamma-glutamyltranspeptidase/glutathione hydrolase
MMGSIGWRGRRTGGPIVAGLALALLAAIDSGSGAAAERRYMVAAANPHAALAGLEMLAAGGHAVDAAIAVQAVLGLVEPQSSGLGGGAFMLTYEAADRRVRAFDGRERAPLSAGPGLFLGPDGEPMKWRDAALSGRSVGAPGVVRMMWIAHRAHGRLAWARLFQPAIRLARAGFAISPRLHRMLGEDPWLAERPGTRDYFFRAAGNGGHEPKPAGTMLENEAYAATLEAIAADGPVAFYAGPVARSIVDAVAAASPPGGLALTDLALYEARERDPVCRPYRAFRICGMPPPTSGGVTTLQIMGLVEHFDIAALAPGSLEAVHLISEASRLAFADRDLYLADPDFVDQPVEGLLAPDYLAARAGQIDPEMSTGKARAGLPGGRRGRLVPGHDRSLPATSHFAIVDAGGNAVSMTTSIESAFGAHVMASGFLLNNQLTDFSFTAADSDAPVANRVEGGKRPRSSMSPTIVLDADGRFVAALGSPGGSRIIGYVARTLVALLDWKLPMREAVALAHHVNRNGVTDLEEGTPIAALEAGLTAMGHEVDVRAMTSGLHGIMIRGGRLEGGADPRREGVVLEGIAR